jgi:membrane-anchored protein YejM (alkaline phosphatase superfamily)
MKRQFSDDIIHLRFSIYYYVALVQCVDCVDTVPVKAKNWRKLLSAFMSFVFLFFSYSFFPCFLFVYFLPSMISQSSFCFSIFSVIQNTLCTWCVIFIMKLYNHFRIYITHIMLTVVLYIHQGQFWNSNYGNIFSNISTIILLGRWV